MLMYLRALMLCDALQIEFAITTGRSLPRMCEISIDLDADSCSIRRVAEEPRCEFPVVPDRLVGKQPPFSLLCRGLLILAAAA